MRVGIVDLLGKEPPKNGYSRLMRANNTSIMPQVVGVWCEEEGHETHIAYYSGAELLAGGLPDKLDLVFINGFSQAALLAYAFSQFFRSKGAVTVLGGPHARSYPEDALKYFDYVVGFCDKNLVRNILDDCSPHRPLGQHVSAAGQPSALPGLRARWKFLTPAMERAKLLRFAPVLGSIGCPYTCSFCIDAVVPYQSLDFDVLKDDLRFFATEKLPRSALVWHDPNFGVRFDDYLSVIEEAVKPGSVTSVAESSLSLLKEDNLIRLKRNGFKAIAPGIESWFAIGDKSKMRNVTGLEKVKGVAEHVNLVQSYIPYTQSNLIFGLDCDEGPEPFEMSKRFVDLAPAAYPHLSVLSSFGRNASLNLEYQRDNRIVPVPFHFMDLVQSMNVRPLNYTWPEFYDNLIDVFEYTFSRKANYRRLMANKHPVVRFEQYFRAYSSEWNNRLAYHRKMRTWLDEPQFRAFFEGDSAEIPPRLVQVIQEHLGPLWKWLPEGAVYHDANAFINSGTDHPMAVATAQSETRFTAVPA